MRNKKILKLKKTREKYLRSVGYRQIEIAELIDIMFTINGKHANRPLVNNMNFETTQIEYNG